MLKQVGATGFVLILALSALGAARQQPSSDALPALMSEVRQLRIALERTLSVGPRIQLLTSRLSAQAGRMQPLERELSDIRQQLSRTMASVRSHTARVRELEDLIARETDPDRRKQLEREQAEMKAAAEDGAGTEQDLRNRESDLANALAVEQAHWNEINKRLDELEQTLERSTGR
jgi:predicted  nucleic acid-binding Zn-ribbon protein